MELLLKPRESSWTDKHIQENGRKDPEPEESKNSLNKESWKKMENQTIKLLKIGFSFTTTKKIKIWLNDSL